MLRTARPGALAVIEVEEICGGKTISPQIINSRDFFHYICNDVV